MKAAYSNPVTALLAALLIGQSAGEVTLPFASPKGFIVAQAAANGDRPVQVLVDTGARRTVVDAALAKTLGLAPGAEVRARGAGGAIDAHFAKGLRLAGLGDEIEAVALPLDAIGTAIGTRIDVILGQDVLAQRVVEIDGAAGRVTFGTRPPVVSARDAVISLHLRDGRPYLMATVVSPSGGLNDAELLLDSGSDTTVELAQPYADEVGLRTRPDPNGRRILGVGGTVALRLADLREIRVGETVVSPQDVRVFHRPADAASDGDGRLGNSFLSRFKAIIDGPGLKLVLRPLRREP